MAARLLQSLTDENSDLQIGCMTGIFQLFDRNQIIAGRRALGPGPKRLLLPGNSPFGNGSFEAEYNTTYERNTGEMKLSRNSSDRLRISAESSRASFSSSRSSVSSVDYDRAAEPEPCSSDRITFPETPFDDAVMAQSSSSSVLGRQSFDLRCVVKDSMYREARGLVKTSNKEEVVSHKVKHRDSPRPLQHSKSVNGSYTSESYGRNASLEVKDSARALVKLQEVPWHMSEAREYTRSSSYEQKDGYLHKNSQDAPRFSYDGRELNRFSFESRETLKSIPKLKELPRLSLDSREGSMLLSSSNMKSNASFNTFRTNSNGANDQVHILKETPRSQQRPPSVVAKLMGLESLPDSSAAGENHMRPTKTTLQENLDGSRSFATELSTPIQLSKIPLNSWKDPASPRRRNPDPVMKPISSSKFPLEPAPWKYMDGNRGLARPASRLVKVPARSSGSFPTVYGEIEKRLKELEFRKSGKDLRALKQILEAIQAKGLIEVEKEEQDSNFESSGDYDLKNYSNSNIRSGNQRPRNDHRNSAFREDSPSVAYNSPIVIMKPANLVRKTSSPASPLSSFEGLSRLDKSRGGEYVVSRRNVLINRTVNNQVSKEGSRDHSGGNIDKKNKSSQPPLRPQQLPKENNINSTKSTGSISPRLQQKKLEIEKRSRPPTPPSDVLKPRRQLSRQLSESAFSGGKSRAKYTNTQLTDEQLSEVSSESKNLSNQGDDLSVSDSITTQDLKIDTEVTSSGPLSQINGSHSPSITTITKQLASFTKQEKVSPRLSEDGLSMEHSLGAPEHPSPVSVLDAPIHREESLSPINQFPDTLDGNATQDSAGSRCEEQYNRVYGSSANIGEGLISEMSHKKLQRIDHLVQKLRRLNSTHDESSTDYIASLCENTNPDHRYISEILLASGLLLRDLSSSLKTFQFHSPAHPINPELFFVLEQTKSSAMVSKDEPANRITYSKSNPEKFHRKLIFDAVNEILVKKLGQASPDPCLKPNKIARKNLNAQKLLKELCSEIEQLQSKLRSESTEDNENDGLKTILCEDVMHRSESWKEWNGETMSGVVLDIERLLFKDLVNEVVIGEAAASLQGKSGRRTRRLFAK